MSGLTFVRTAVVRRSQLGSSSFSFGRQRRRSARTSSNGDRCESTSLGEADARTNFHENNTTSSTTCYRPTREFFGRVSALGAASVSVLASLSALVVFASFAMPDSKYFTTRLSCAAAEFPSVSFDGYFL